MIYLELFLNFFKIGAVSFGGGYGMISLVRETVLANGWLTEEEFINMIAVSESTPGPIAVNMATFVGSTQGGVLGSVLATIGVVLPAFIIMLLISTVIRNFIKYKGVQAFLGGVRPAVVGLIIGTALTMFVSTICGIGVVGDPLAIDYKSLSIFAIIVAVSGWIKNTLKKKPSPILLIVISAGLGIIFYSF